MPADVRYDFRDVTPQDLPVLAAWLAQPHWSAWWEAPDVEIPAISAAMDSIDTEPLMVELEGRSIAYVQVYDPHLEDAHPYRDQPFGTLGLDLSIGPADLLGQGHGPAMLAQLCQTLFDEGCCRVIIDPHPENARAIRAYEKAGFAAFDSRVSPFGPALLMALDAQYDSD